MTFSTPRSYAELRERFPHAGIVILAITSWFLFSLLINLYNKWMFSDPTLDFKFPVLITACHQLILFILSSLTLLLRPKFRLNYVADPTKTTTTVEKLSYFIKPQVYITKILPCALSSAGDIGLGNSSLKYITISLYTMLKTAAALIFTLFWGFTLRLEKVTLKLFVIITVMTFSVMMLVYGQNENKQPEGVDEEVQKLKLRFFKRAFGIAMRENEEVDAFLPSDSYQEGFYSNTNKAVNYLVSSLSDTSALALGCFLVVLASCLSGLRWALTQIVLRGSRYAKNPILTIFYLSPAMSLTLLIMGYEMEGISNFINAKIWTEYGFSIALIMILFPGILAYCMTLSQFIVLQYAPLLTLSIAGIVKQLVTIFLGWLIFDDKLNTVNVIGLLLTLIDLFWYNVYRLEQSSPTGSGSVTENAASSTPSSASTSETVSESIELQEQERLEEQALLTKAKDTEEAVTETSFRSN